MVETEKPSKEFKLPAIIARYIKMLSSDSAFSDKTPAQVRKEALKRASEAYQQKPDRVTEQRSETIKKNTEEWGKKRRSENRAEHNKAAQEIREEAYEKLDTKHARERLKQVRRVSRQVTPDWLGIK